jgi:hypothetical protein
MSTELISELAFMFALSTSPLHAVLSSCSCAGLDLSLRLRVRLVGQADMAHRNIYLSPKARTFHTDWRLNLLAIDNGLQPVDG